MDSHRGIEPPTNYHLRWNLSVVALFGIGAFASIPIGVSYLSGKNSAYSSVMFPMILVAGVVAMLATLSIMVGLFKALGLANENFALGMPDGSIRAVLALLLILLFGMMAIFLYIDTADTSSNTFTLKQLSAYDVGKIPIAEIVEKIPSSSDPSLFDVQRRTPKSEASTDLAKQLVTTVSTLVVAISSFYFGSQAVSAARRVPGAPASRDTPGPTAADSLGHPPATDPHSPADLPLDDPSP